LDAIIDREKKINPVDEQDKETDGEDVQRRLEEKDEKSYKKTDRQKGNRKR